MNRIIDLGSEFLIDQSTIRDPYLRLLAVAIGQKLIPESPWLAINKGVAQAYCVPKTAIVERNRVRPGRLQELFYDC
jgi:hypothetical protein